TKGTINEKTLAMCKDGVRIINLARGELVDDAAIIAALGSGKAAAYVTDFPNDNVLGAPGVIPMPHLGASTPEAEDNCAVMAADELADYILNGNIRNSVNFPNASMNAVGTKICVMHKNVPAVISQITTILGNDKINIENMCNASKKDYAYTIIDAVGDIGSGIVDELSAVENVIRVRVIG
ncbi:MAG: NAD(P)-dependent oxidoreductase, partial [Huintestinicola sp.]